MGRVAKLCLLLALCGPERAPAQAVGALDLTFPPPSGGDDTLLFQTTINRAPAGSRIYLGPGHYTVNGVIAVAKAVTLQGAGLGTQIYEAGNQTLFRLTNVNGAVLRDVYLGSNATAQGASLIELVNSNHNEIQNVTMLGGYYGLHLSGSLLKTIVDLRTGINFGGFFASVSTNNTWVRAEPANNISANANTFLAPALEGGTNGLVLIDGQGQGSVQIVGGTIEGVSGVGLTIQGAFLPSSITGVDFESNGQDIAVTGSSNIRFSAINSVSGASASTPEIAVTGDSRNIQISDSVIETLSVAATVKRVLLQNVTFGTAVCPYSALTLPAQAVTPNSLANGTVPDPLVNITAANVGDYCGGQ